MKKVLIMAGCLLALLAARSCSKENSSPGGGGTVQLVSARIGNSILNASSQVYNVPRDQPIIISFTSVIDTNSVRKAIALQTNDGLKVAYSYTASSASRSITLTPTVFLDYSTGYVLTITPALKSIAGETFPGVQYRFTTLETTMIIDSVSLDGIELTNSVPINIDPKNISFRIAFSEPLDPNNYKSAFSFSGLSLTLAISDNNKTVQASSSTKAKGLTKYSFSVSSALISADGFAFNGYTTSFYTGIDSTYQFPMLSDDDLLTLVQQQTFKYFWDFGHPVSGMARERNTSGDVVTTGGSGFGIMAMIVAMDRGFISRADGISRLDKILGFLETCDRFHGAYPHWLNGATGKTVPFSSTDNGGDIVETSYLMEGLLTMKHYLNPAVTEENSEINRINALFNSVEFDWYTNGEKTLYWLWSPDHGYTLKIQGYNETLIAYVLAASSPTHSIGADVYTMGYAANGAILNGRSFYGYLLPLGPDYGGPLFFTHYSFLGIDPRHLRDQYADYWEQNVNQSLINWAYCQANPGKYPGYGPGIWGLTASDNPWGYNAHSPTNDLGVITPTAAISSIVYTPDQSMEALKTFYYFLGDHLWGPYGFYDAFDVTENWWATSSLAIDEGPIICMIENYRSGLLWSLFMSDQDVRNGLTKLGFTF